GERLDLLPEVGHPGEAAVPQVAEEVLPGRGRRRVIGTHGSNLRIGRGPGPHALNPTRRANGPASLSKAITSVSPAGSSRPSSRPVTTIGVDRVKWYGVPSRSVFACPAMTFATSPAQSRIIPSS